MSLVLQSLNAATALGPGEALMFDVPRSPVGLVIVISGTPIGAQVDLEGTIDGVNWAFMANSGALGNGVVTSATWALSSDIPVMGVRANLVSLGSPGSSPLVSAWVSAKG